MLNTRTRTTVATAAVLVAAATLSSCGGNKSGAEASAASSCVETDGDSIKLGFLNSTSGAMSISEQTVRDSLNLAAAEINASGGILDKEIEVVEDPMFRGITKWS